MDPQQQPQPYVPPNTGVPPQATPPANAGFGSAPAPQQPYSAAPAPSGSPLGQPIDLDQPPPGYNKDFTPISQQPQSQPQQTAGMGGMPPAMPPNVPAMPPTPADGAVGSGDPRQEIIARLKQANNVLVTVSNNPSVDQLSAAIGLTLLLNKLDKHATAVFSGEVPSTIEFLQPEKTIEKNTDSLRDFIIALDKSKADKLRYKVEDKFVKIFITPYHTSLSQDDLEFSQGDFNVDVVIAIGVQKREELDQAITAHGRILHDAVVACVNNLQMADLGSLNWFDPTSSSLCEMLVSLIEPLQGKQALLDEQIATALLTGVVAETERFSNDKTSPRTMNVSATLMKAGANQQLVASKLEEPAAFEEDEEVAPDQQEPGAPATPAATPQPVKQDGSLEIKHAPGETAAKPKTLDEMEKANAETGADNGGSDLDKIHIDDQGRLQRLKELQEQEQKQKEEEEKAKQEQQPPASSNMILNPPTLGGALSANTKPEAVEPSVDPLSATVPNEVGSKQHGKQIQPLGEQKPEQTLQDLEQAVDSPHVKQQEQEGGEKYDNKDTVEAARKAVDSIENTIEPEKPQPKANIGSQIAVEVDHDGNLKTGEDVQQDSSSVEPQDLTTEEVFPTQLIGPDKGPETPPSSSGDNPTPPPPVPPPLMPTS